MEIPSKKLKNTIKNAFQEFNSRNQGGAMFNSPDYMTKPSVNRLPHNLGSNKFDRLRTGRNTIQGPPEQ